MFRPTIGITMGDPSGIGPEVIVKALKSGRLEEICQPLVLGSATVLHRAKGAGLPILDCVTVDLRRIRYGKVSSWAGRAAAYALRLAVQMALDGYLGAVVTGPVSKEALHLAGYRYPGQTEFLATLTGTKRAAMMLTAGRLRVVLASTHIPLSAVSSTITKKRLHQVIELAHAETVRLFGVRRPRVGVCALNPHAGEGGIFGREEKNTIIPVIREFVRRGFCIQGPLPADTLFAPQMRRQFDVIVAMYHDQGLLPVKMMGFGKAVNVTLGLPIIRTSPDHGTAFDIAGQGKANPESMIRAIRMAARIAERFHASIAKKSRISKR
jgi:4-hydroxythreonine-4-phosphate dehydrogenase